jgi:hypothetical protein
MRFHGQAQEPGEEECPSFDCHFEFPQADILRTSPQTGSARAGQTGRSESGRRRIPAKEAPYFCKLSNSNQQL